MQKFLVDSDVIIWYLRGRPQDKLLIKELATKGRLYMSVVTITEVRAGITKNADNILKLLKIIFVPININGEVAQIAGEYRQKYKIGIADMLIAASAALTNSKLVTYNKKHFPMKEVKLYNFSKS